MTEVSVFDIVRPFLWIGAFAFVVGFAGYVFFGAVGQTHYAQEAPAAVQALAPGSPPPMDLRAA